MSGQRARHITWLVSGYDLQVHAFYDPPSDAAHREALCTHTVPVTRLLDPADAPPAPHRCVTCLLVHGGDLSDQIGDSSWR